MTTIKEYEKEDVRKFMYGQLELLMKAASDHIYAKDEQSKAYYNSETHHYIDKNSWELLFPLEKERWPDKFNEHQYAQIDKMLWPGYTTYCYMMDVIAPPFIPYFLLHFGYAVVEGKLIRSAFFVVQSMVKYQEWPQGMVIDPLAEHHGVKPSFYIGCAIHEKEFIENWMLDRKNPLEMYVKNKHEEEHKERIRSSYMEAYFMQMSYEPGWFPEGLIEFAKKEGLYVPPQERT